MLHVLLPAGAPAGHALAAVLVVAGGPAEAGRDHCAAMCVCMLNIAVVLIAVRAQQTADWHSLHQQKAGVCCLKAAREGADG
jgi:hypothetical protein